MSMTNQAALLMVAAALAVPAQAPSGPCQPVFDAMLKEAATPHHLTSTRNGAQVGESIATADATFIKVKGEWRKSPITPQAMLKQQQENIADVRAAACTSLPGETVDGQAALVYHAHYQQKDAGMIDAKVWLAKVTGLPIRTESTEQADGVKNVVLTQYDYANIKPPAVK